MILRRYDVNRALAFFEHRRWRIILTGFLLPIGRRRGLLVGWLRDVPRAPDGVLATPAPEGGAAAGAET